MAQPTHGREPPHPEAEKPLNTSAGKQPQGKGLRVAKHPELLGEMKGL